jgi:hypothetical protein
MAEYKGTAKTVGELKKLLEDEPDDLPVRLQTISHEFPPDVYRHQLCIMLEP